MSPSARPSRRSLRQRTASRSFRLTLACVAMLSAAPAAAHAADPSRFIGIGTDGTRTELFVPIAVSNDGSEILGDFNNHRYPVIRDIATGVSRDILHPKDHVWGASADLKRIAFSTELALVPGDTNTREDLYMWDRPSNTYALVSKDVTGQSLMTTDDPTIYNVAVSNLGTAIIFSISFKSLGLPFQGPQYRYEASRSYTQKISDNFGPYTTSIGDNATTLVTRDEVISPAGRFTKASAFPFGAVVTSPDGGFVAWATDGGAKVVGVDASNGATGSITVPDWLVKNGYRLEGIANGAGSVTVSAVLESGKRFAFARMDRNGNLRQIGSDIPITAASPVEQFGTVGVLSRNEQFGLTSLSLVKFGSLPLLGTEPTAPSKAKAADYLSLVDARCPFGFGLNTNVALRPQLTLSATAQGSDLRVPVKATFKAWKDGSSTISNDASLSPGQAKNLYVGVEGGFRVEATVTLAGGQVFTITEHIGAHAPVVCG